MITDRCQDFCEVTAECLFQVERMDFPFPVCIFKFIIRRKLPVTPKLLGPGHHHRLNSWEYMVPEHLEHCIFLAFRRTERFLALFVDRLLRVCNRYIIATRGGHFLPVKTVQNRCVDADRCSIPNIDQVFPRKHVDFPLVYSPDCSIHTEHCDIHHLHDRVYRSEKP